MHQESLFTNSVIRALESRGYHTRWLQDGKTAVKFFAGNKPILHARVILVEDNLPNANALDILKHFKRDKNARRSKIFWLSSQLTGVETPLALGCFDYVNIPCNISAFMHRLHQALES